MRCEGFLFSLVFAIGVWGWDRVRSAVVGATGSVRACRYRCAMGTCGEGVSLRACLSVVSRGKCGQPVMIVVSCGMRGEPHSMRFTWRAWRLVPIDQLTCPRASFGVAEGESSAPGEMAGFCGPVRQFGCERASRRAWRCDIVASAGNPLICGCVLAAAVFQTQWGADTGEGGTL